jgi:AraC family transcriptional regulator
MPFMPPTEINRDARGVRRTGCRWSGFEIAALDYPAGLALAPHDHDRPNVTLVLRGSLVEEAAQATHEAGALSVVVKPAGLVHANRFGPTGARTLSITFDERLALEPRWRYRWEQGGREAALVLQMYREWRLGDEAAGSAIESLVLELAALAPPRDTQCRTRPPWLEHVLLRLHDCRLERIPVGELAAQAGVHPVHLARTFRRHLGCTIGVYVRRLRLEWAMSELAASRTSLCEIALRAGFADQSHFTRALKEQTGLPPGTLRRLLAE